MVFAAFVLVAACTSTNGDGHPRSTVASPSPTVTSATTGVTSPAPGSTSPAPAACPSSYAAPDPHRPRVQLHFTYAADLTTVSGTERIAFTPDLPITELVFRLTANTAPSVQQGNRIMVTSAVADHGGTNVHYTRSGAGAGTQGGLLHIGFPTTISPGTTVTANLAFTLTLGNGAFDRFGRSGDGADRYAWIGSGQPLLAWQRGFGWHSEDLIQFTAESATSEAMDTDLTVTAPGDDTVIMSGDPTDPPRSAQPRTWHSTIAAARDVSVAAGPFAVTDTTVNGVRLRVGATSAAQRDRLVPEFRLALTQLAARFGPYPFPSLSVARLPIGGGGIEYPSSILMLDDSVQVAVHETAHQWFYAMVGDSQALHPWLDEAFADYAEQLVDSDPYPDSTVSAPGRVDSSTESYGTNSGSYYYTTYNKGSTALRLARRAAGATAWDAAMRCYVAANAWRIAVPADFEAAMAKFPAAIAVLRKAGAVP